MNKLGISKILDMFALITIVVVFAFHLFKKFPIEILSLLLLCIAVIKMFAYMLKSSYYAEENKEIKQERDILKEKVSYLEQSIDELNNK
ncbi:MAG: hypothetical protein IJ681_01535 [Bacteroidales bacterium]|nr:hypothetical protein [Bacteroidales bacterium]